MSFVGTGVTLLVVVASVVDSVVRSALVAVVELVAVIVGGNHHCRGELVAIKALSPLSA